MGGRLGDRRSRGHSQATLALLAFSEDSAKTHCRTITHVISVFLLGSSETKVTQNQTKSYKHIAFLFVLGAPAPGSHRTPQCASERCQDASERSQDASGRPRRSRTPQEVGPSPGLPPVLPQCCPSVAPSVAPMLPQCCPCVRETAGKQPRGRQPGDTRETPGRHAPGRQPGNTRETAGRQPGDSRETAGRRRETPGDTRETPRRRPGDRFGICCDPGCSQAREVQPAGPATAYPDPAGPATPYVQQAQ